MTDFITSGEDSADSASTESADPPSLPKTSDITWLHQFWCLICIFRADMKPDKLQDDAPPLGALIGGSVSGIGQGRRAQNGYRIELFLEVEGSKDSGVILAY